MKPLRFEIEKEVSFPEGVARVGTIQTPHGVIQTPAFIPVGTKATVKGILPESLEDIDVQAVLANTYHLYLQPGHERVEKAGGLHSFMNWNKPTMTDSGGFQVFSLGAAFGKEITKVAKGQEELFLTEQTETGKMRGLTMPKHFKPAKIDEKGVMFRSHIDGTAHYFTPEVSIDIQHALGADIIFAFDECTSPTESIHYQRESLDRTHRWARESLAHHQSKENASRQALYGIVQGGQFEELRKRSAQALAEMDFDGYGIGGSFTKADMSTAVGWVNEILPKEKPRHLLGIGEPEDLFMAIERGCDTFDCVNPTRIARTGTMYTAQGKINLLNAQYADDFSHPDSESSSPISKQYTLAYLHHLFKAHEMLGPTLVSIHNVHFIVSLVARIRQALADGTYESFKADFFSKYRG